MPLSTTTRLKCRDCGTVYPQSYTATQHSDRDHCDGQLDPFCDKCEKFLTPPHSVCPICEHKAQQIAEEKRRREERRRQIVERKKDLERQVATANRSAFSTLNRVKCRECGAVYPPTYVDEEHHDNEHCDGPLEFFCEECQRFQAGIVCSACEARAQEAERERQEQLERERLAAEERERLRREHEERLRIAREKEERRARAFTRIAMVPAILSLVASLLCFLFVCQLFTHGGFVLAYSGAAIMSLLAVGIVSAVSLLVVALFFSA
jgi:hypothetical protein